MSADEVTASTLSKDQDMREADEPAASKKAAADIAKLEKDLEAAKSLAKTVNQEQQWQHRWLQSAQACENAYACLT